SGAGGGAAKAELSRRSSPSFDASLARVSCVKPVPTLPTSVIEADEKGRGVLAAALRQRVPADDELGLFAHLDLAPEGRTHAGLVCGALVLGDDPLPAETFGFAIRGLAVADEAPRDKHGRGPAPDERLERGPPLAQRPRHQRSAVLLEEVEDRVPRRRSTGGAAPLQQLKPRDPFLIQGDELAVD